jgi:sulfite reductase (NADPH) hemoprotein beta-component
MYVYDEFDHTLVRERTEQFRDQVARRLSGEMSEEEFRPLRLMNGLYLQLHAYMLRVAIPYGTFTSKQMRQLAHIARKYDRGYGHFTTRQNIQFNWPKLEDVPDILADLADVEMHAIQTSGNCIRNVTADQFAGVTADEADDSRIWAEIVRQWSTFHPEFTYLPRKFKFAFTASEHDRAAVRFHDIGVIVKRNADGELGFEVLVGGGLGRTPMMAKTIRRFVPERHLLSYIEAILRIYNLLGRRDNKYKARIKILVHELGIDELSGLVEAEWERIRDGELHLPDEEISRIRAHFTPPQYETLADDDVAFSAMRFENTSFNQWVNTNISVHKQPGYAIATITLKPIGGVPGDVQADEMDKLADLADKYSMGELRATHEQNLVLPDVRQKDLFDLWTDLTALGFGDASAGLISDIIVCPGMDYCGLATARSIPVAQRIAKQFADLDRQLNIGELKVKISGCINACAHHHVGHIGILGVDRKGEEYYQITLGGSAAEDAAVGTIVGPAVKSEDVVDAVDTLIGVYLDARKDDERFLDTYRRIGLAPFKTSLYPEKLNAAA